MEKKNKRRKKLYTENWDSIRHRVYLRDGFRCVMCNKKGKINAHHIIPVAVSHDNSMSNLITVCDRCHKKLETVGYKILEMGGHKVDVRRVELKMIAEARKKREKNGKIVETNDQNIDQTVQKNESNGCENRINERVDRCPGSN